LSSSEWNLTDEEKKKGEEKGKAIQDIRERKEKKTIPIEEAVG
jgi:hypothetical protein